MIGHHLWALRLPCPTPFHRFTYDRKGFGENILTSFYETIVGCFEALTNSSVLETIALKTLEEVLTLITPFPPNPSLTKLA